MSHASAVADLSVVVPVTVAGTLYLRGTVLAWRRAGVGRGVPVASVACFWTGLAMLALALVGPVDRWGAYLFSAHMAQHTLMMNIAAPLLVLGAPLPTMLRALPAPWRSALVRAVHFPAWQRVWRALSGITVATTLQLVALAVWHWPSMIAASLRDEAFHALMHSTLLASALLFWSVVFDARAASRWRGIAGLVVTMKASGLACILLLLSDQLLYLAYGAGERAAGLSALDDERLGWGLMMLTAGPAYFCAAAWLFARALAPKTALMGSDYISAPRAAGNVI